MVIDNIDMNIRRSEQRMGRTTKSYHYCHGYAVTEVALATRNWSGRPYSSQSAPKKKSTKLLEYTQEYNLLLKMMVRINKDSYI